MTRLRALHRRVLLPLAVVASLALAGACGSEQPAVEGVAGEEAQETIHVNYGFPKSTYMQLFVAQDLDLFEKHGLDVTFHEFQSGAPMLAALKSGSLDVITTGSGAVFALGQGIPLKFILWSGDPTTTEALIVPPDSPIESLDDIEPGMKIAAATGTSAQLNAYWSLRKAGLTVNDVTMVNLPAPLLPNAFASGDIDAGVTWAPYTMQMQEEGYRIIAADVEVEPHDGLVGEMVIARPDFLSSNAEAGERLVRVFAEAMELIEQDPSLAVTALQERLSLSPSVAQATFDAYYPHIPSFEEMVAADSPYSMTSEDGFAAKVLTSAETFHELGVIPEPLRTEQVTDAIDPSYIQAHLEKES